MNPRQIYFSNKGHVSRVADFICPVALAIFPSLDQISSRSMKLSALKVGYDNTMPPLTAFLIVELRVAEVWLYNCMLFGHASAARAPKNPMVM